jgi:uncharacterized protein involved in tolerance to divalent cations
MSITTIRSSAPTKQDAVQLATALVEASLVAGTRITDGESIYQWESNIQHETYWNLQAYTVASHLSETEEYVLLRHPDETPIITFHPVSGNDEFERWVRNTVQ